MVRCWLLMAVEISIQEDRPRTSLVSHKYIYTTLYLSTSIVQAGTHGTSTSLDCLCRHYLY